MFFTIILQKVLCPISYFSGSLSCFNCNNTKTYICNSVFHVIVYFTSWEGRAACMSVTDSYLMTFLYRRNNCTRPVKNELNVSLWNNSTSQIEFLTLLIFIWIFLTMLCHTIPLNTFAKYPSLKNLQPSWFERNTLDVVVI